jgi:hypothetical protein
MSRVIVVIIALLLAAILIRAATTTPAPILSPFHPPSATATDDKGE